MANSKFKVGDIVRLTSAPLDCLMTIDEICMQQVPTYPDQEEFAGSYMCSWFNADKEFRRLEFKEDVLISASFKMN